MGVEVDFGGQLLFSDGSKARGEKKAERSRPESEQKGVFKVSWLKCLRGAKARQIVVPRGAGKREDPWGSSTV